MAAISKLAADLEKGLRSLAAPFQAWGMPEINELSKAELRDELKKKERRESSLRRRNSSKAEDGAELTGFVLGTVGLGYLEARGTLPPTIGGIDTEILIGGGSLFLSRGKRGKRAAVLRGFGYGAAAGALKDIGRKIQEGGFGG